MKRKILALALVGAFSTAVAQQAQMFTPYTPEPLPTSAPRWMEAIASDPTGVNYAQMDSLFQDWLASDVDARVKTLERKPAVNFYRRWARAVRGYVDQDGRIVLPTMAEHIAMLERRNAQAQAVATNARLRATTHGNRWRNIGPNATYKKQGSVFKEIDSQVCVYRIAVAPSNHNILYSGTQTGVVFRTNNKGKVWEACAPTHSFGGEIYSIAVSPTDPNVVYVGGGSNLWKSVNGGASWTREEGINMRVNSIRISPTDPKHITLSGGVRDDNTGGFYISTDGGQTYRQKLTGICHDHELQPGNAQRVYVLSKREGEQSFSLRLSENGGETFRTVTLPVKDIVAGRLAVSEAPTGRNYVYALVNSNMVSALSGYYGGVGTPSILKSVNAGESWTDETVRQGEGSTQNTFSNYLDYRTGGQGYFDMMIGVSNKDPEHVIFGLCNGYRSTRGGKGAFGETVIGGYGKLDDMHPDMQDIAVAGDDTWISTDGGIRYSQNFFATPGEPRQTGIYASDYHGFGQAWNEDVMAGGRWHNGNVVHAATYGEGKTRHVGGVEQSTGHVMLSDPRKIYFSDDGMCIVSDELDGHVEYVYNEYFSRRKPFETIHTAGEIAFDPRYAHRLMIQSVEDRYEMYLSEDEGRSFRKILDTQGEQISSYTFARSAPDNLFVSGIYDIHHSADGGKTWRTFTKRPFDMRNSGNTSSQIAVHPKDERTLWMAYSNTQGSVAYTTDQGETWHYPLTGDMKKRYFHWVVLVGDELNGVYLGTIDGASVYYKDDSLPDWIDYSAGINPGARITRLTPFYKEGKMRMATNQGVWEIPLYRQDFTPVAQPLATNLGGGDLTARPDYEVQFESYSIVNQKDVQWAWSFSPQPEYVSDPTARNPRVRFGRKGDYDVTLTVTTPAGTHTRTMPKMIRIGSGTGVDAPGGAPIDVRASAIAVQAGEPLRLFISGLTEARKLTLHNSSGALIRQMTADAEVDEMTIDTAGLPAGVYIYELRTASYKSFGKFIVR